jgi:hypothetical protein
MKEEEKMRSYSLPDLARIILNVYDDMNIHNGYEDLHNYTIKIFEQTWCNTSGAFESIGGSAMTKQYTICFINTVYKIAIVYFNDNFGYKVNTNDKFMADLNNENLAGVKSSKSRYDIVNVKR